MKPNAVTARAGPSLCVVSLNRLLGAIRDENLDRGNLKVLAHLIECFNAETLTAWPSRQRIGDLENMSAKTVANKLYELRDRGYISWDRQPDPKRPSRTLVHYRWNDEVITAAVKELQRKLSDKTAPPAGQNYCAAQEAIAPPTGHFSCPAGGANSQTAPSAGLRSAPYSGLVTAPPAGPKELDLKGTCREGENARSARPAAPHMNGVGFVISGADGLIIPTEIVAGWRSRFPHIRDLDAQMTGLGVSILSKGRMHPGWSCPEGWMVKVLADINDEAALKKSSAGRPVKVTRYA